MEFFKKIAIGVIVGFILMFARKYLFINASAIEYEKGYTIQIAANGVSYQLAGESESYPTLQNYWYDGLSAWVRGFTYTGNKGLYSPKWYIPVNSAVNNTAFDNGLADLSFLFVSEGAIADYTEPYTFEVSGVDRGHYSCESTSSVVAAIPYDQYNEGVYVRSVRYTAVRCPDIPLDQDYRIIQTTGIFVNGKVGITDPTWSLKVDNSSNQAVVNAINNSSTAINNSIQEINDADISSSTKESVDDSDLNDYTSTESDLFDSTSSNYSVEDTLDVGLDANGSLFLWDTITSFIHTHVKVFGCVISMLSLGIIKLALGR